MGGKKKKEKTPSLFLGSVCHHKLKELTSATPNADVSSRSFDTPTAAHNTNKRRLGKRTRKTNKAPCFFFLFPAVD